MNAVRAAAQYRVQQFQLENGVANACAQLADPDYTSRSMAAMDNQKLQELDEVAQKVSRGDRLPGAVCPLIVREIGLLEAQKKRIEDSITALQESYAVGFADKYYQDTGYHVEGFYEELANLKRQFEIQAAAANIAAANAAMVEGLSLIHI